MIDFKEWDKQLENGKGQTWSAPINVPKEFIEPTEDELYRKYFFYKNQNYPVTEYDKQKFLEYDFEFRAVYEAAHSINWMFDNCCENVKRKIFPWIYN